MSVSKGIQKLSSYYMKKLCYSPLKNVIPSSEIQLTYLFKCLYNGMTCFVRKQKLLLNINSINICLSELSLKCYWQGRIMTFWGPWATEIMGHSLTRPHPS